jgi:hypothetical protein
MLSESDYNRFRGEAGASSRPTRAATPEPLPPARREGKTGPRACGGPAGRSSTRLRGVTSEGRRCCPVFEAPEPRVHDRGPRAVYCSTSCLRGRKPSFLDTRCYPDITIMDLCRVRDGRSSSCGRPRPDGAHLRLLMGGDPAAPWCLSGERSHLRHKLVGLEGHQVEDLARCLLLEHAFA